MGKLEENKRIKKKAIIDSAFSLFTSQGINNTSISDIMHQARLAKGTFYLYFNDKYQVRDYLIRQKAAQVFMNTKTALESTNIKDFEDKVLFLVDHVLMQLEANKVLLRFIARNLSWSIFKEVLMSGSQEAKVDVPSYIEEMFLQADHQYKNPELLMYMIIEIVNSTCHSVILDREPVELKQLKEMLYPLIRQLIRNSQVDKIEAPC